MECVSLTYGTPLNHVSTGSLYSFCQIKQCKLYFNIVKSKNNIKSCVDCIGREEHIPSTSSMLEFNQIQPLVFPFQMTADRIFRHFQLFYGNVENVDIQIIRGKRCANVTFSIPDTAVAVAKQLVSEIDGARMNVSITLMALNDETLLDVFKHLKMEESYKLATTCRRFNSFHHQNFAELYQKPHVTLDGIDDKVLHIIREYGYQMESIRIKRPLSSIHPLTGTRILAELMLQCKALTAVEMVGYTFCALPSNTPALTPFFKRLRSLKLKYGEVSTLLLPQFDVKELVMEKVKTLDENGVVLPMSRLKTLTITENPHAPEGPSLLRLTREPKPIQHLVVDEIMESKVDSWFSEIRHFRELETLRAYCKSERDDSVIEDEDVTDEFSTKILRLSHLIEELPLLIDVVLGYPDVITPTSLLRLIKSGPNLERLIIILNYKCMKNFNVDKLPPRFGEMLDVVSKRPNKKRLHVILIGGSNQLAPFQFEFPAEAPIRISCMKWYEASEILDVDDEDYIRLSNYQIVQLLL